MAPISHMRKLRLKKWAKRENQVLLTPECSLYVWIATSRPRLGQRDKLSEKQRLFERPRSRINFTDEGTASVTSPRLRGQQRQLECQAPVSPLLQAPCLPALGGRGLPPSRPLPPPAPARLV